MTATAARMVKEHPILFSGGMVCRLLDGAKTQTRRVVTRGTSRIGTGERWADLLLETARARRSPGGSCGVLECQTTLAPTVEDGCARIYPPWDLGERLWVRETWVDEADATGCPDDGGKTLYRATDPGWDDNRTGLRWRPSIFMPRRRSRILLEITQLRVERLQAISHEDAIAEGVLTETGRKLVSVMGFAISWNHINAGRAGCSFEDNPWVWVIGFRVIKP